MCAAILTLAAAAFVFVACDKKDGTEALPLLSADGEDIVNSAGETVALRGTNFGGWLVQESWMCPTEQTDTLETNMTHGLSFYPNPTKDYVYIRTDKDTKLRLYSLSGIEFPVQYKKQEGLIILDLRGLKSDTYLLRVGEETLKIQKK